MIYMEPYRMPLTGGWLFSFDECKFAFHYLYVFVLYRCVITGPVCMFMCALVPMQMPEEVPWSCCITLLLAVLIQDLLLNLKLSCHPESPQNPSVPTPKSTGLTDNTRPCQSFCMGLGTWTKILMLAHQAVLSAEPSPWPLQLFFNYTTFWMQ